MMLAHNPWTVKFAVHCFLKAKAPFLLLQKQMGARECQLVYFSLIGS